MKIAIIGTGNVGGALGTRWSMAGHTILLGVRDPQNFKGKSLIENPQISAHPIADAVREAEVILLAVPAPKTLEVLQSLGDTEGKVIIDAMNVVRGNGPEGYSNTLDAILDHTATRDAVKCFNTTGFNNMLDPVYDGQALDVFMAGDSARGKQIARQLALDAGFAECYDVGNRANAELLEQFAWFWINLAGPQGLGREIGFKLLKR